MKFSRYHALGNDYIVVERRALPWSLSGQVVQRLCHRNFGIGSDGILVREGQEEGDNAFALTIFNPDGSRAEKSGNGLRIFARYLWDHRLVGSEPFAVQTAGGRVACRVAEGGRIVTVEMGTVSFDSARIPVAGEQREVIEESIVAGGTEVLFCAATVGNPHCVVLNVDPTRENAERLGPLLERHPLFPNRTNVQLLKVLSRNEIQLEIWERGAGYTLASGSSSSAAAAVAKRLGLVGEDVTVRMPGGSLSICVDGSFGIKMTGPVTHICDGELDAEALEWPAAAQR